MADKYVQLKDNNGNNLYPAVADFPLSVANGGTGTTSGALFVKNFTKQYTVNAGQLAYFATDFVIVPQGYELVGFLGFATNHDEVYVVNILPHSQSQYAVAVRNVGGSAHTADFVVFALFARTGLVTVEVV